MKSVQLFFLTLLLGFLIGCAPDLCEDIECGPGNCFKGICECPDGFSGVNCNIEECFGVGCVNGDCDPQTESCLCYPNYYGDGCNIKCVNGEFANGDCNCSEGYEGITCETVSRCRFMGWWGCDEWTSTSHIGGTPTPGVLPASMKFEEGYNIFEVELFPTESSNGLLLLSSGKRIVGKVSENKIDFELQYISSQRTVNGSASLGFDRILRIELFFNDTTTSSTEVARGTFRLARHIKE